MKVEIKKVRRKPGEGSNVIFYAEYPVFSPDEPETEAESKDTASDKSKKKSKKRKSRPSVHEKLNRAVESFVESAAKSGKEGECINLTNHIYQCDDNIISFSLDVLRISGTSLVYIRRFCFNWDCKSGTLLPLSTVTRAHRRLKKQNGGTGDYTLSPGMLYIHKNTFTPEAGQNCRRSRYKKFLSSVSYDLNDLVKVNKVNKSAPQADN